MSVPPRPPYERALAKFDRGTPDECWLWRGSLTHDGYPRISQAGSRSLVYVHRLIYEVEVGPIPAGHDLDHTCLVRSCVNPAHGEPVTPAENRRRRLMLRNEKGRFVGSARI